ncbi:HAD family hydrolase [Rickettsiales endosymbiont of Stachyamoeba lipophora]|uniref:HAD family hydrolase n=1 Tax=Rickettsiales endosymbiont of Stachyamoeba lipophora TaxID=2486578 RepID=UPI000F651790|nr:HAD family hydrolase [Rickettsiales endosymbiont of Stachyamoeba lipophora]AZL15359.1 HAD family hydrolase [Rickettsiales endosymbiont of Stachyamoeba lipophora]
MHNKLTKPHAIIFDWDNTLADTWIIIHQALNNTFNTFNLPEWSLEETKERVALSMRDAFPKLFGENVIKAREIYYQSYLEHSKNLYQLFAHAREMLEFAKNKNILLAVVSNKNGPILRKEVAALNLNQYFHNIIGSMDAEFDKPYPHPVYKALELSDITAGEHVWFIGDTIVDMECAHRANLTPIYYGVINDPSVLAPFNPQASIKSHQELIKLIDSAY